MVEGLLSQLQLGQRCSFLPQPRGLTLPPFLLLARESGEQCRATRNHTVLPEEGKRIFPGSRCTTTCPGCTLSSAEAVPPPASPDCPVLVTAQQPELKCPRNHCQGCLTLVRIYFPVSFTYFLPQTKVHHSTALEHPSPGKPRPKLAACAVLPTGFTAGMESPVLTGREGGRTPQRSLSLRASPSHLRDFLRGSSKVTTKSKIKARGKVLLCCCLAPLPAPRSCGARGALH